MVDPRPRRQACARTGGEHDDGGTDGGSNGDVELAMSMVTMTGGDDNSETELDGNEIGNGDDDSIGKWTAMVLKMAVAIIDRATDRPSDRANERSTDSYKRLRSNELVVYREANNLYIYIYIYIHIYTYIHMTNLLD